MPAAGLAEALEAVTFDLIRIKSPIAAGLPGPESTVGDLLSERRRLHPKALGGFGQRPQLTRYQSLISRGGF